MSKKCAAPLIRDPINIYREQRKCPQFSASGPRHSDPCVHYQNGYVCTIDDVEE